MKDAEYQDFLPFSKRLQLLVYLLLWNVGYLADVSLEMLFSMLEEDSLFQHSYFSCAL